METDNAKKVIKILMDAGDHCSGGSEEEAKGIAEEWINLFSDVDDPIGEIEVMVDLGYWDPGTAREVRDHVYDPTCWLSDCVDEWHDKVSPVWDPMDDRMDVPYALCNRDTSISKLTKG